VGKSGGKDGGKRDAGIIRGLLSKKTVNLSTGKKERKKFNYWEQIGGGKKVARARKTHHVRGVKQERQGERLLDERKSKSER